MTNRAIIVERTAGLWTDFGYSFAVRLFGEQVVADLPKFVKGKNKGKTKAIIVWKKVERGGWVRSEVAYYGERGGHVESRVGRVIEAEIREATWNTPGRVLKQWDGQRRAKQENGHE